MTVVGLRYNFAREIQFISLSTFLSLSLVAPLYVSKAHQVLSHFLSIRLAVSHSLSSHSGSSQAATFTFFSSLLHIASLLVQLSMDKCE